MTLSKIALLAVSVSLMGCQMTAGQLGTGTHIRPSSIDSNIERFGWEWDKDVPKNSWSYNMVDTDARSGSRSQRLELRNGDCTTRSKYKETYWGCKNDRERVEFTTTRWDTGEDMWISLSVKLGEWEISQKEHCTNIFQIHQYEDNVDQGNRPQNKTGDYSNGHYIGNHGVVYGVICGNKVGISINHSGFEDNKFQGWSEPKIKYFGTVDSIKGKWHDLAFHWDTSDYRNGNSTFEMYVNGKNVITEKNITNNFFPEHYSFKYGLYRGYMNKHGVTSGTQILYFDENRYGNSLESVSPNNNKAID